jgi:hypothetical protein
MPSDGGYPTMLAQWLTLLFLAILSGWFYARRFERLKVGWASMAGAGVVLGLAMLTHTATLLLTSCLLVGLVLLLLVAGDAYKYLAKPAAITLGIGWAFALGIYYGFYVIPVVTQTLPGLASKVGQGENVGSRSATLTGFWPELVAHFHLLPFLVTVGLLAYLAYLYRKPGQKDRNESNDGFGEMVTGEIQRPAVLLLLAWLGTFLLFSLAASRINLLHKHMLFALPLFALGCGLALAFLLEANRRWRERSALPAADGWRRYSGWSVMLLIAAVAIYFISAGSYTWFQRVINYILPAGTG